MLQNPLLMNEMKHSKKFLKKSQTVNDFTFFRKTEKLNKIFDKIINKILEV